jgi:hypothetical protein
MFENHSKHRVIWEKEEDTYRPPAFGLIVAPLGLVAKMCINSNEHSMTIIFLWSEFRERVASTFKKRRFTDVSLDSNVSSITFERRCNF